MLIEALTPLRVRLNGRELLLDPGRPYEFSEDEARRLLAKAPGRVRIVEQSDSVVIESAPLNAKPIYWQRATGIVGPAIPEFVAMVGIGPTASFWVVAEFEGSPIWVNSIALRSKEQFEAQLIPKPVDLIREW